MDETTRRLRAQVLQLDALRAAGTLDEAAHATARGRAERALLDHLLAQPPGEPMPWRLLAATAVMGLGVAVGAWWLLRPAAVPGAGALARAPAASPAATAPHGLERGAMQGTIDALAQRLAQRPDDAEGWAMLGRSHKVLGDRERAAQALQRAVALRPGDAALAQELAAVQADAGR